MSTTAQYTQALKSIKDADEKSGLEIAEKKRKLAEELQAVQDESEKSILAAKAEGESSISMEIEKARRSAQSEADKLLASTSKEAEKTASTKIDDKVLKKMINDILLAEFRVK